MKLTRVDKYRLRLEPEGETATAAIIYLPEGFSIEDEALAQLRDTATVDEEAIVLATPDIHTGFGVPIGTVFATAKYVSPCAVGYD
ncbi:MAG: RtcB family protein, partial [Planctomycetota bacterium]|nr:RtcB family protein [Planctomycetota bacterium]